ncbi:MAG: class I SAM-dependent methyltransferase [Bacteroidota bacterium]
MQDNWLQMWNNRYQEPTYAYGIEPNVYLKEKLDKLGNGSILFGAEGEGRNALYAAKTGWDTHAFDISKSGKQKALQLAKDNGVPLNYQVGQLPDLSFQAEQFDVIALIYAHFPPDIRSPYHRQLGQLLKKGGHVILEAFGKNHLPYRAANPKVGGPGNLDFLFSVEEIRADFANFEIIELVEKEVALAEGLYHNGKGSVVRFVGQKL